VSPALRIVWTWRARAIASAFAAATAALTVWAAVDPRSDAWVAIATALLATVWTLVAVETHVFRVDADSEGLRRRSLRGADTLAWSAIRAVRLVDTRQESMAIVHARTTHLGAAFHVRLVTEREGGRPWNFNGWMDGFDDLLGIVAEREWPRLTTPQAPDSPLLGWTLRVLGRVIELGWAIVAGFALLFALFMASLYIVDAGVEPTRYFGFDLLIVALALLAAAWLVDSLVRKLGARRLLRDGLVERSRADWMMSAAGLVFGVLMLVLFVPEALAGDSGAWLLVGLGALGLLGTLLR
jgi:Ca2+/Na+ antiporter